MKAVGEITGRNARSGFQMVKLYFDGKQQEFCLSNPNDIPSDMPDFGLFSFNPEDQFLILLKGNKLS